MAPKTLAQRIGRLFVIKTRWEAWAVTWAIALGAAERGKHYLALFPGALGWLFFAICCAVVFVAGAKLLDATRPEAMQTARVRTQPAPQRLPGRRIRPLNRSRLRAYRPADEGLADQSCR